MKPYRVFVLASSLLLALFGLFSLATAEGPVAVCTGLSLAAVGAMGVLRSFQLKEKK